jgi:hypothetical protein
VTFIIWLLAGLLVLHFAWIMALDLYARFKAWLNRIDLVAVGLLAGLVIAVYLKGRSQ